MTQTVAVGSAGRVAAIAAMSATAAAWVSACSGVSVGPSSTMNDGLPVCLRIHVAATPV